MSLSNNHSLWANPAKSDTFCIELDLVNLFFFLPCFARLWRFGYLRSSSWLLQRVPIKLCSSMGLKLTLFKAWFLFKVWLALIIRNHGLQTSVVRFGVPCWHYPIYVACSGVACSYYTQSWLADFNGAVRWILLALFYVCGLQRRSLLLLYTIMVCRLQWCGLVYRAGIILHMWLADLSKVRFAVPCLRMPCTLQRCCVLVCLLELA